MWIGEEMSDLLELSQFLWKNARDSTANSEPLSEYGGMILNEGIRKATMTYHGEDDSTEDDADDHNLMRQ